MNTQVKLSMVAGLVMLVFGAGGSRVGSCAESRKPHGQQGPEAAPRNACFHGEFDDHGRNNFVEGDRVI